MADANPDQKLVVGRIGAVFGVKGWLKLHSFTQPKENIFNYAPWYIKPHNQQRGVWQTTEIRDYAIQHEQLIVLLADIASREQAQLYTGLEVAIDRGQLPALAADEYYWTDLQGLTVINTEGVVLGRIDYLFSTGSNDVMVVKGDKQHLIPFLLEQFVVNIDWGSKTMQVAWDADF